LKRSAAVVLGLVVAAFFAPAEAVEAQDVRQWVRYEAADGEAWWGELVDETIHQMSAAPYLDGSDRTGVTVEREAVRLLAPAEPTLVVMTALNFISHLGGQQPAEYPGLFIVPPHSVVAPDEAMYLFPDGGNLHYEAEAVIIIGQRAQNVPIDQARDYIFGITAGNDGSERSWQLGQDEGQWARGKGADTLNPVGPILVSGVNPNDVMIVGRLNGEERQRESTSDMLFNFDYMVSYISHFFTLEPGDMIWSGTPGTTQAMSEGDVYEVEIEGISVLRNPIAPAPADR
jgi:2-keto-4-pentenoate hydratase/2-oxohepta-3-ene-1,7-dioic acid hydratase in catechol pathway